MDRNEPQQTYGLGALRQLPSCHLGDSTGSGLPANWYLAKIFSRESRGSGNVPISQ